MCSEDLIATDRTPVFQRATAFLPTDLWIPLLQPSAPLPCNNGSRLRPCSRSRLFPSSASGEFAGGARAAEHGKPASCGAVAASRYRFTLPWHSLSQSAGVARSESRGRTVSPGRMGRRSSPRSRNSVVILARTRVRFRRSSHAISLDPPSRRRTHRSSDTRLSTARTAASSSSWFAMAAPG